MKTATFCMVVNHDMKESFYATLAWAAAYAENWVDCEIEILDVHSRPSMTRLSVSRISYIFPNVGGAL